MWQVLLVSLATGSFAILWLIIELRRAGLLREKFLSAISVFGLIGGIYAFGILREAYVIYHVQLEIRTLLLTIADNIDDGNEAKISKTLGQYREKYFNRHEIGIIQNEIDSSKKSDNP